MANSNDNITLTDIKTLFCPWCGYKVDQENTEQVTVAILLLKCDNCTAQSPIITIVEYSEPPDFETR